jgi:hypothetical protein
MRLSSKNKDTEEEIAGMTCGATCFELSPGLLVKWADPSLHRHGDDVE